LSQKLFSILKKIRNKGYLRSFKLVVTYGFRILKEKFKLIYLVNYVARNINKDAVGKIKALGYEKGLFLDCGSNIGQGFNLFRKIFKAENFDYELFEPNPNCIQILKDIKSRLPNCNININQSAIGVSDGVALFYGLSESEGGRQSQGASILKEHNSALYASNEEAAIRVITMDFIRFINDKSKKYDVIVIKMDIEGGEYELLEKMIETGSFKSIHSIFCEFHSEYIEIPKRQLYKEKEDAFEKIIRSTGCTFVRWI
jgi:FkbM family methyltransferase